HRLHRDSEQYRLLGYRADDQLHRLALVRHERPVLGRLLRQAEHARFGTDRRLHLYRRGREGMIRTFSYRLLLAVSVIAGFAWGAAAVAQTTLTTGSTVERILRVNGKEVPLPGGSWVVAADTASDWNDQSLGAFGYLRTLV